MASFEFVRFPSLFGSETHPVGFRNCITHYMRTVRALQNWDLMGTFCVAGGVPPRHRDYGKAARKWISHRGCADARCGH